MKLSLFIAWAILFFFPDEWMERGMFGSKRCLEGAAIGAACALAWSEYKRTLSEKS